MLLIPLVINNVKPIFQPLHIDIFGDKLYKIQNPSSIYVDRNGGLHHHVYINLTLPLIGTDEPTAKLIAFDREKAIITAINLYPFPDAPAFIHEPPPPFLHTYTEPVIRPLGSSHPDDQDGSQCVISMEPILTGDTYWACNTCNKLVMYDVFMIYMALSGSFICPHCRSSIHNNTVCYINNSAVDCQSNGLTKHMAIYNAKVEEYNSMARAYLAAVDAHHAAILAYNTKCEALEAQRKTYIDNLETIHARKRALNLCVDKYHDIEIFTKTKSKRLTDNPDTRKQAIKALYRAQRQSRGLRSTAS
jgi:hypothetical protein